MRRLEAYAAGEARRRFAALDRLSRAVSGGELRGLARGVAWRMLEVGGVIDRRQVEPDLSSLSHAERRALRALGVRIGAFCVYLPSQVTAEAAAFAKAFAARSGAATVAKVEGLLGLARIGPLAVPVMDLERLAEAIRAAPRRAGGAVLDEAALQTLGLTAARADQQLRALGFAPVGRPRPGQATAWRRRRVGPPAAPARPSPFAALAALEVPPRRKPRRRRRARG